MVGKKTKYTTLLLIKQKPLSKYVNKQEFWCSQICDFSHICRVLFKQPCSSDPWKDRHDVLAVLTHAGAVLQHFKRYRKSWVVN